MGSTPFGLGKSILQNKVSGKTPYRPDYLRLGMGLTLDPSSFILLGPTSPVPPPAYGGGPVSVSGRRMCYTVAFASDNFWLRPGGRYCTDILSIDARTHRYRDIDTQQEFTLHRVAHGATRCPADNTP